MMNGKKSLLKSKKLKKKVKNYSDMIREMNFNKKKTKKRKKEIKNKKMSKREIGLKFAKNIKKPKIHKFENNSISLKNQNEPELVKEITNIDDHLRYLEEQHNLYKEKLKNIKY